jgi:hypothetical protein
MFRGDRTFQASLGLKRAIRLPVPAVHHPAGGAAELAVPAGIGEGVGAPVIGAELCFVLNIHMSNQVRG